MGLSVLPDRERRHLLQFYFFQSLGYRTRIVCAGSFILAGVLLEILLGSDNLPASLVLGLPLLLAGTLLPLVRGYDLRPSYRLRRGDWEKTTRDRFREIRQLEAKVRGWDETFADITCIGGAVCLVFIAAIAVAIVFVLGTRRATEEWAIVFAADAAILFLPHWITGTRRGWRPVGLRQQVNALETALGAIEEYEEPPCQIQPMLEVAGEGKSRTPLGARVFIRFPDGPGDFLGLQFQVALNDVQGTRYPYLYAVIVAKKPFQLHRRHGRQLVEQLPDFTVESSTEEDVEAIVIRQHTTEDSGYHTDATAVHFIARSAWHAVTSILAATPARG